MLSSGLQEKEHEPSTIKHWLVETICELRQDVHGHFLAAEYKINHQPKTINHQP
jgi:hypothetical protein